ncbi:unnamed protein product [[Candida] boidinii]|nr:unnamed protein product [[Candida] boidinii]
MSSSLPELMSLMGGLDTAKPSSVGIDQQTAQPDLSKRSQPQPPQQTQSQPQEIQQPQQPQIPQQSQQQSSQQQSSQQQQQPSHQQQKPQVYQKQQPDQLDSKNMNNIPNPQLDSPSDFADDSFDLDMQFEASTTSSLNMLDLKLMHHYSTKVWPTITAAGISDEKIWNEDIPNLAFKFPFLMRLILTFSATHLSRTERGLDTIIIQYRAESLKLLREAVLNMNAENTDALVASALILIMDSLANASSGNQSAPRAVPASAWVFHVKGAATILTAVWPLPQTSRFYKFINIDLGDLGDVGYDISGQLSPPATLPKYVPIQCFDDSIADLFPLTYSSPYVQTLSFMHKLHLARHQSDFILRIFAFPALLERKFLQLLITCDLTAMRIMRSYYKLLRDFVDEMKDRVWFLEGVSTVLPVDVEEYSGGGGMNMMVDFLGGGPTTVEDEVSELADLSDVVETDLLDTNNLPSSVPGLGDNNDDPSVAFMGF